MRFPGWQPIRGAMARNQSDERALKRTSGSGKPWRFNGSSVCALSHAELVPASLESSMESMNGSHLSAADVPVPAAATGLSV